MMQAGGTDIEGRYRESSMVRWPAAILALVLNGGLLGLALAHHHVAKTKRAPVLTVIDVLEPPPLPPSPSRQDVELAIEKPRPIVAPRPLLLVPKPAPPIEVVDTPSPPQAEVVAAPESPKPAPAGPVDAEDLAATMTSAVPPGYPTESRRAREQGTVVLLVLVGEDGRVLDVSVRSSSGHERLDRAALAAVRRWRWSPRVIAGSPVRVRGLVRIPFVLRGA